MGRLAASVTRAAPWGMAVLAALLGGLAVVTFSWWAAYFLFQTEPRSVPAGLLWFAVALSVPIAAESARRYGSHRGERGKVLTVRVSVTTVAVVIGALGFMTVLRIVGAFLGW